MTFIFAILLISLTSLKGYSCSPDGRSRLFPENDLHLPFDLNQPSGITQSEAEEIIKKIELIYSPIIKSKGLHFKINKLWTSDIVNCSAILEENTFFIELHGGLTRHPLLTRDSFALTLCHELGHYLGGAPKFEIMENKRWSSLEGQADYFATLKCMRRLFYDDNNAEIVKKMNPPMSLVEKCFQAWGENKEKYLCIRSGMAGLSFAKLLDLFERQDVQLYFDKPDTSVTAFTLEGYPGLQCRLDTFLHGSLCKIGHEIDVSSREENVGTCYDKLVHENGFRPLCWYNPMM
jgi:hypothetical protein